MRLVSARFRRDPLPAWKRGAGLFLRLFILFMVLLSLPGRVSKVQAEVPHQSSKVQAVLAAMTPEEKMGQLFLVTFQGTDTGTESQIYDLIANHHVGGVVLLAENDNFVAQPDTITGAHQLIADLQTIEAQGNRPHPIQM